MKHTFLPMGIVAAQSFVMLVLFGALYRKLSPASAAGGCSDGESAKDSTEMDTLELAESSSSEGEEVAADDTERNNFLKP